MNSQATENAHFRGFLHISGGITAPQGFAASGIYCGIKPQRPAGSGAAKDTPEDAAKSASDNLGGSPAGSPVKDLALIVCQAGATAAGLFTRNKVKAAPVLLSRDHLESGAARAIVVTSGNANACTGPDGMRDARAIAEAAARNLGIPETQVLLASTGVIGVRLPIDRIIAGLPGAVTALSPQGGRSAAEAIITTDTAIKETAIEFGIGGSTVRIGGVAKGSGMIHPDLATMLAFITTDAAISKEMLRRALVLACEGSFNMITVDGDTSTNDTVFILASGLAGNDPIDSRGEPFDIFTAALGEVCLTLAKMIVRDGEGATKFVEIAVKGARSVPDARAVARTIASSNLVKTAIFGADVNWGRVLAAAGRSGVELDPEKVDVYIGKVMVASDGHGVDFSEAEARQALLQPEITITVDLNLGKAKASAWTCDLTYDYVKINASYRS